MANVEMIVVLPQVFLETNERTKERRNDRCTVLAVRSFVRSSLYQQALLLLLLLLVISTIETSSALAWLLFCLFVCLLLVVVPYLVCMVDRM